MDHPMIMSTMANGRILSSTVPPDEMVGALSFLFFRLAWSTFEWAEIREWSYGGTLLHIWYMLQPTFDNTYFGMLLNEVHMNAKNEWKFKWNNSKSL